MKIVILGSGGRLGAALLREYRDKFDVAGFNHTQLNLSDLGAVREKLRNIRFDILINAAGFTKVDLCETQPDRAFLINAEAPRVVAEICYEKNARLIHFSTDYVFGGDRREPYTEEDQADPISVYGESKLAGENNVLAAKSQNLVVRVSWVFGPDRPSFIDAMIQQAQENDEVDAVADKFSTPSYTLDIAAMLPQFFDANVEGGILHFANAGQCSWREYAQWAVDCCHDGGLPLKAKTIGERKLRDMTNWIARRPIYSVLSSRKYTKLTGISPRTWREAVSDYITRFYSKK
ncbi:MAG: dTDP-4-dehydrorhamnose reductase [Verrucomicrobia bacterium 13_2_20CM_54_12]|nr:MAG: dTDP-4-dehydrorhamnose reductase [Verrucomicrobia bacterium 13_2_20CM_54_12]OLB43650.1 MAG: dTDP-4-dehydrorhamnose reductase [Verrucomicrobia bacterium 13_2_20CM_2_54_15]OLE13158.1 MAG: dTDP-4-dehydrorhamnose reductase [Verrucomicrobia bacterium 13_1_20CM_3_54_17]